ncbi:beta-ketoacyl-ACP synthase II [Ktedonospora formicarum]|uniref:3-oxoacyl-[acyl-carrier-protein] synthase 2 n=1 Tax=Ktedonospora formicarum TaxID=2778364 RepID=A0A8J3I7A1_9CHLR|nr:beta-ketoacyl-ACP synthase II [Ktedonospora formicarum]GHO46729.1 3-oxoacyl-[acyl-carrier-protein] synthase 2 [Ktedonospora formicarum]
MKRVVVTGMGMVTSLGHTVEETWKGLLQGRSGISPITSFDASEYLVRFAGEVKDFDASQYMDRKEARRNDPFTHIAVGAARQALAQSGLEITKDLAPEVGVYIGSGVGGLNTIHDQIYVLKDKGPSRVSPFTIPMLMMNAASGMVSLLTGAQGPVWAAASACATGGNALGEAWETIRRGTARVMLAGGSEKAVTPLGMAAFANMHALSRRNDEPQRASRPFDAQRDGFVMGEGAGMLVLEDLDFALERGAPIIAEMVGYGSTADAYHVTEPAPGGEGMARAIRRALQTADLTPEQIDYINAHGTSTSFNDSTETQAIKAALGEHAYKIPISSTKSMLGHTFGAAGAIEAAISILSITNSIMPPTINLENPDPACDLDYIPNQARSGNVRVAISNSMGFGGHNTCLAFQRYE